MNNLRQRALWAIIQNAVFSPLSAVVIAAAVLLIGLGVPVPLVNAPPAAWLIGLAPLWLGVVGLNVVNRQAGEQAASQVFRDQFDLNQISNSHLRTVVAQAIAYRERIDKAVNSSPDGALRSRLKDVADQVQEWVLRIYTLAQRLDAYRNDSIISNDLKSVPQSIQQLQARLKMEDDESVKVEVRDTIGRRQAQLDMLKSLDTSMDRAELQLENTLTALGTVYSQMLLIDARDVKSAKTQRLRDSISDQVNSLQDVLTSLDEVYNGQRAMVSRS
jgi:hypothetical protein